MERDIFDIGESRITWRDALKFCVLIGAIIGLYFLMELFCVVVHDPSFLQCNDAITGVAGIILKGVR